tara:strand:- start:11814 stop:12488 length:675 start_codon:yes stop_codon:yes gene_type:complete
MVALHKPDWYFLVDSRGSKIGMKIQAMLALMGCTVLLSCQTMSKEECAVADWRVVGEQDGAAGYSPQDRFSRHTKACEKAGVAADQTLWYQGYQQGLPHYCTPLNGLSVGSRGQSYANVCPADLDPGFRNGYELGRSYNRKKREIRDVEARISRIDQEIRDDGNLIGQSKADKRAIERRIASNRWTIHDLERDIGRLQADLRRIEDEMDDFRYNQTPGDSTSGV